MAIIYLFLFELHTSFCSVQGKRGRSGAALSFHFRFLFAFLFSPLPFFEVRWQGTELGSVLTCTSKQGVQLLGIETVGDSIPATEAR